MAGRKWDEDAEASAALFTVQADYGPEALSRPQLMASLLKDMLPDAPREANVLIAAADADLAGLLRDRITSGMTPAAAASQAASVLEERTGLAADACQWAATTLSTVIGFPPDAPADGQTGTGAGHLRPDGGVAVDGRLAADGVVTVGGGLAADGGGAANGGLAADGGSAAGPGPLADALSVRQADGGPGVPGVTLGTGPGQADDTRATQAVAASGATSGRLAITAAVASVVTALLVVVYVPIAPLSIDTTYACLLSVPAIVMAAAAVLTILRASRQFGLGATVGAGIAVTATLWELDAGLWISGSGRETASAVALLAGAVTAAASAVCATRALGLRTQRTTHLGWGLAAAGACFAVGGVLPEVDYYTGSSWQSAFSLFQPATHGWQTFAGVVFIVLFSLPLLMAVRFVAGRGPRLGLWTSWLISSAGWLAAASILSTDPAELAMPVRVEPGLFVGWALWLIVLGLGAVMLARGRAGRMVAAVPSAP